MKKKTVLGEPYLGGQYVFDVIDLRIYKHVSVVGSEKWVDIILVLLGRDKWHVSIY